MAIKSVNTKAGNNESPKKVTPLKVSKKKAGRKTQLAQKEEVIYRFLLPKNVETKGRNTGNNNRESNKNINNHKMIQKKRIIQEVRVKAKKKGQHK